MDEKLKRAMEIWNTYAGQIITAGLCLLLIIMSLQIIAHKYAYNDLCQKYCDKIEPGSKVQYDYTGVSCACIVQKPMVEAPVNIVFPS